MNGLIKSYVLHMEERKLLDHHIRARISSRYRRRWKVIRGLGGEQHSKPWDLHSSMMT